MSWPDIQLPNYKLTTVGRYNPIASTVLVLSDITWADGSTDTPVDTFPEDDYECPFDEDDVSRS
jgi:hypothetical protein